jgi:hypothetical protein
VGFLFKYYFRFQPLMRLLIVLILLPMVYSCGGGHAGSERPAQGGGITLSQPAASPLDNRGIVTGYMSFYDSIGQLSESISKVIPEGFLPMDTAIGDLNLDGIDDVLLVVKNEKEHTIHTEDDTMQYDRPLLLLLGTADGTYSVVRRNDHVVLCINCSGAVSSDPYNDLKIKNGFFSVEHGVDEGPQHWSQVTTFRYNKQEGEWYLFKEGHQVYDPIHEDGDTVEGQQAQVKTKKDFGVITFAKYKIAD